MIQLNFEFVRFLLITTFTASITIFFSNLIRMEAEMADAYGDSGEYLFHGEHFYVMKEKPLMDHLFVVMARSGFRPTFGDNNWDIAWTITPPFIYLKSAIERMKPHGLVNHFPRVRDEEYNAFRFVETPFLPKTFMMPEQKIQFLLYSETNPRSHFVVKHVRHTPVAIKNVTAMDVDLKGAVIQEYVENPLLVDGYKFDISVYVILTSVDPLRVYIYNGDFLIRYSLEKYNPFNPVNTTKYVVRDEYLDTKNVAALNNYSNVMGLGMKDSLDYYIREKGKDPEIIWNQIYDCITTVFLKEQHHIRKELPKYKNKNAFFELMRFDFIVDDGLAVHSMGINTGPYMKGDSAAKDGLFYQRLFFNILSLVGATRHGRITLKSDVNNFKMRIPDKHLTVWPDVCVSDDCYNNCKDICSVCRYCMNDEIIINLAKAINEHYYRLDCKRIYPPPMSQEMKTNFTRLGELPDTDKFMYYWFEGKCNEDVTWCE